MNESAFARRRARMYAWMKKEGLNALMFEDAEGARSTSVRYLSGQPGDALLFLIAPNENAPKGEAVLVSWDVNMARRMGQVDTILAYTDYGRDPAVAAAKVLKDRLWQGARVELPSTLAYPRYVEFVEALADYDLVCRSDGAEDAVVAMRAVKDADELAAIRKASAITDDLIKILEEGVRTGKLATELDLALAIEREARTRGCEGLAFETLAAGPARSFGIHAFPPYGPGAIGGKGMTILDFGVKYAGYCSDVTLTFVRGPLDPAQEEMIAQVEKAAGVALSRCTAGTEAKAMAQAVDDVFAEKNQKMPHALGHGIGLEDHEGPYIRSRADNPWVFADDMVVAVEPGLYDDRLGGVRLENDVLVHGDAPEVLTHARIVRL